MKRRSKGTWLLSFHNDNYNTSHVCPPSLYACAGNTQRMQRARKAGVLMMRMRS